MSIYILKWKLYPGNLREIAIKCSNSVFGFWVIFNLLISLGSWIPWRFALWLFKYSFLKFNWNQCLSSIGYLFFPSNNHSYFYLVAEYEHNSHLNFRAFSGKWRAWWRTNSAFRRYFRTSLKKGQYSHVNENASQSGSR
jgi:hypothetical protein